MTDSVEPTDEDIAETSENEVEAHIESPLGLQEMSTNTPALDQVVGATSSVISIYACC